MSFNSLSALLVAVARERLGDAPTAIDLGNQRLKPSPAMLQKLCDHFAARPGVQVDQLRLRALVDLPAERALGSVRLFYEALGFGDYQAIDVNENFGSVMMDLNRLLVEDYGYGRQFDLVINNGTGEHVFNQYAVFRNIHDLCRDGGLMLHIVPFVNYLNHGFYSFHPALYCDLAEANGYGLEGVGIGVHSGQAQLLAGTAMSALLPRSEFPLETVRRSIRGVAHRRPPLTARARRFAARLLGRSQVVDRPWETLERLVLNTLAETARSDDTRLPNILVFALLRRRGKAPFRIPFQGKYAGVIDDAEIRSTYAVPSGSSPVAQSSRNRSDSAACP